MDEGPGVFIVRWALQTVHPVLGNGGTQEGELAWEAQSESVWEVGGELALSCSV